MLGESHDENDVYTGPTQQQHMQIQANEVESTNGLYIFDRWDMLTKGRVSRGRCVWTHRAQGFENFLR